MAYTPYRMYYIPWAIPVRNSVAAFKYENEEYQSELVKNAI